jgi:hypothetical protein
MTGTMYSKLVATLSIELSTISVLRCRADGRETKLESRKSWREITPRAMIISKE